MSDEEKLTLHEMLAETIAAYCAQDGLGFPAGFVYCVSRIMESGEQVLTLGEATNQPTHVSLGMTEYLKQSFSLDAQQQLTEWAYNPEDE